MAQLTALMLLAFAVVVDKAAWMPVMAMDMEVLMLVIVDELVVSMLGCRCYVELEVLVLALSIVCRLVVLDRRDVQVW